MRAHSQWTRDADPMVAAVYNAGQTPLYNSQIHFDQGE